MSGSVETTHSDQEQSRPKTVSLGRWRLPRNHPEAEQFRSLGTRLRQLIAEDGSDGHARLIGITSATPQEGKTTMAVNLAVTLARDFHHRVLLLEADLRQPSIHTAVGSAGGLVEHVKHDRTLEEVLLPTSLPQLTVLTAGVLNGANSIEHLGNHSVAATLVTLREFFDFIVVDCPPLLPAADMGLISEWLDHIVLVIRAGVTSSETVRNAVLGTERAKFAGAVLNGMTEMGVRFRYQY